MVSRWLLGTCLLASGCYMDFAAGVHHAGGGASGYGWDLTLVGGVAYDIAQIVKPSIGFGATMRRANAQDGTFGTTGLAYHGRLDVTISSSEHISEEDIAAKHPGMEIPSGGADARTKITFDYGWGKYEKLYFKPDGSEMTYEPRYTTHSLYLGIAREYDVSSVQASFGIGPSVTLMPNDFVGDTTSIGVQFHSAFWFIPVFRPRPSGGGLLDNYSGPTPITPLPQGPPTPICEDRDGHQHPCY